VWEKDACSCRRGEARVENSYVVVWMASYDDSRILPSEYVEIAGGNEKETY
jgi:hypothetical protein